MSDPMHPREVCVEVISCSLIRSRKFASLHRAPIQRMMAPSTDPRARTSDSDLQVFGTFPPRTASPVIFRSRF